MLSLILSSKSRAYILVWNSSRHNDTIFHNSFVRSEYITKQMIKILHHKQSHIVYLNAILLTNLEVFLHWDLPLIQWVGRIKNGSQSWNIFVQQVLVGFGLILSSPSWFLFSFSFCATTDTILMDIQSNYKISFAFSAFWN